MPDIWFMLLFWAGSHAGWHHVDVRFVNSAACEYAARQIDAKVAGPSPFCIQISDPGVKEDS